MMPALSSSHCCSGVGSVYQWQLEFRAYNLSKQRRTHNRGTAEFIVLNDAKVCHTPRNSNQTGAEINLRHVKWIPSMSPPQFSSYPSSPSPTEVRRDALIASSLSSSSSSSESSAVLTVEEDLESDDRMNSSGSVEDLTECMDREEDEHHLICEGNGNGNGNVFELAFRLHSARTEHDVNEVLKDNPQLPLRVYSSLIRIFAREKNLEPALALVKWMEKETDEMSRPNEFIYHNLLLAAKQSLQHERADEIITGMSRRGLPPTATTYSILMSIYTEMGSPEKALDVFDIIRMKRLGPSRSSLPTYFLALVACGKLNDGIRAVDIFLDFKSEYSEKKDSIVRMRDLVSNTCRGAILKRLRDGGSSGETYVMMLLKRLDDAGIRSGRRWQERLVWVCTRPDQCGLAKSLYVRARDGADDRVSAGMCNHVMRLMGRAKKFWPSLRIFEEMIDGGPTPTEPTLRLVRSHYEALLIDAGARGCGRLALRLLERMEQQGIKPAIGAWEGAMAACSKSLDAGRVVEVFRRMVEHGVTPTLSSYVSLLGALEKGKLFAEAVRIWGAMRRMSMHSARAYTVMGSVYAAVGEFDELRAMVDEMVASGVGPRVSMYNAIIESCAREWGPALAFGWFEEMRDRLVVPDGGTYEIMIRAVARDDRNNLALQLFCQAAKLGIRISRDAYSYGHGVE